MKNCYTDLEKILTHFGCTFDDVVEENIFTTDMPLFLEKAGYRNAIYTKQFPTDSWLGVKDLALPELMIEVEGVALVDGEEATLKRLEKGSGEIVLHPANSALEPMHFSPERVQIQGVLAGQLRDVAGQGPRRGGPDDYRHG